MLSSAPSSFWCNEGSALQFPRTFGLSQHSFCSVPSKALPAQKSREPLADDRRAPSKSTTASKECEAQRLNFFQRGAGRLLEGFLSPVTNLVRSPRDFLFGGGAIVALTCLSAVGGGAVVTSLIAISTAIGVWQLSRFVKKYSSAKDPVQKAQSFYHLGESVATLAIAGWVGFRLWSAAAGVSAASGTLIGGGESIGPSTGGSTGGAVSGATVDSSSAGVSASQSALLVGRVLANDGLGISRGVRLGALTTSALDIVTKVDRVELDSFLKRTIRRVGVAMRAKEWSSWGAMFDWISRGLGVRGSSR